MVNIEWTPANALMLAFMIALSGLLVGALARWIMPGPDPMSWPRTILLGIAGSFLGGIVAGIFGWSPEKQAWGSLALAVAGAFLILSLVRLGRRKIG